MANLKVYPYKMGSGSAKDLSRLLNAKRVRPDGTYIPKVGHTVINWGSSVVPNWFNKAISRGIRILNNPKSVKIASNKLYALSTLDEAGVPVPEYTTSISIAQKWVNQGYIVIERHLLNGNSARGTRAVGKYDDNLPSDLQYAPLYTKYIPKTNEFRVHIFNGEVIDYIEKKRKAKEKRPENYNKYLCSHEMGWVFCRRTAKHIDKVKELAKKTTSVLGLDFAAVDIIWYDNNAYVLEANTAPGIMGYSLRKYVNSFRNFVGLEDAQFDVIYNDDGTDPIVNLKFESFSPAASVGESVRNRRVIPTTRSTFRAAHRAQDSNKVTIELSRELAKHLYDALARI